MLNVLWLFPYNELHAQNAPKYSNEFLSIGVGARALAMGQAVTSTVSDLTAGYWTPSGLTDLDHNYQIGGMHAEYFAGIAKYDYLGFAARIDSASVLAVTAIRFGVDDIPDTRFLYDANGAVNYDNIRFFSAADYGFLLSYARDITGVPGLSLGGNVKLVHRIAGSFATSWGFGLDFSATYRLKQWNLALMGRDITGTFNAWSHNSDLLSTVYNQTGNDVPENSVEVTLPKLIFGASRIFHFGDNFDLNSSVDLQFSFDGKRNTLISGEYVSIDPRIGLESSYKRIAFLRFGLNNMQYIEDFQSNTSFALQWNAGIGTRIKGFEIDYALSDFADPSETILTHIFSLKYRWN
jgi:hypothetical protein